MELGRLTLQTLNKLALFGNIHVERVIRDGIIEHCNGRCNGIVTERRSFVNINAEQIVINAIVLVECVEEDIIVILLSRFGCLARRFFCGSLTLCLCIGVFATRVGRLRFRCLGSIFLALLDLSLLRLAHHIHLHFIQRLHEVGNLRLEELVLLLHGETFRRRQRPGHNILLDRIGNGLGPLGISQSIDRFLQIGAGGRYARHHDGAAVATEAVAQDASELAIPVGDVSDRRPTALLGLVGEGGNDLAQNKQVAIDRDSLLLRQTLGTRLLESLGTRQVHQRQLGLAALPLAVIDTHGEDADGMTATGPGIGAGGLRIDEREGGR